MSSPAARAADVEVHEVSYFGYNSEKVPCTSSTCAYLDMIYGAHDRGIVYTGVFWFVIVFLLLVAAADRLLFRRRAGASAAVTSPGCEAQRPSSPRRSAATRLRRSLAAAVRRRLLPSFVGTYATRLQVLTVAVLIGYTAIFTFVGITYGHWPQRFAAKDGKPGYTVMRSSLNGWSNRIGMLAYALTPLSVLLASRESVLSVVMGIPHTSFVFFHRWVGYTIVMQSALHTIGWLIVETKLYQPQPDRWYKITAKTYIVWGLVATVLLFLIWVLWLPWTVRHVMGYELFCKMHYVLAMV